jgi:tyrosyl-tRNA synthetase
MVRSLKSAKLGSMAASARRTAGAMLAGGTEVCAAKNSQRGAEGNAIWLDPKRTTPYQFYQFWVRTDDRDVERYLKLFTFESIETIDDICASHKRNPERREAQKLLAASVTEAVHGKQRLQQATRAADVFFGREIDGFSDADLAEVFADVPSVTLDRGVLAGRFRLVDALVAAGAAESKGQALRLMESGGVYVNNRRATSDTILSEADLASETMLVLRTGKKHYRLVRFL